MQSRFTKKAQEALDHAAETAAMLGHGYIGSEHLLIGLIQAEDSLASTVLLNNDVTAEKIINLVYQLIAPDNQVGVKEPSGYTPRVRRILENSAKEAARFHADSIGTEHLLIAIIKETESVAARLLNTLGIAIKKLYVDTLAAMGEDANSYREDFQNGRPRGKKPTQTLDQYSRDLTELARNGKLDPVIGRSEEIQRVIQILSRRTKNNPCLIGEPGVGKTAIAEGLAARIVEGDVPETIKGKRLLTLDLSGMVAGSKYRGEFEERIKRVINEVKADGNVLLFLDELHTIIGAGGAEGAIDASNILKPSLARGEIQLIGATTLERVQEFADANDMTFWDALCNAAEIPNIGRGLSKIESFVTLILGFQAKKQFLSIRELTETILEDTRYMEALAENETKEEIEARQENIDEFMNKIISYEEQTEGDFSEMQTDRENPQAAPTLSGFLEEVALIADIDNLDQDGNQVMLMTLHSAKGLEFPIVYMTGLEDGLFPSYMTIMSDDPTEVEEERRLCYVGITRAQKELNISAAKTRMIHGETQMNKVSRFVKEIPENLLEVENHSYGSKKSAISFGGKDSSESQGHFDFRANAKAALSRYGSGTTTYGQGNKKVAISGQKGIGSAYATNYGRTPTNYGTGNFAQPNKKVGFGKEFPMDIFDLKKPAKTTTSYSMPSKKAAGAIKSSGQAAGGTGLGYRVGDTVSHVKFGTGQVLAIEDGMRDYMVTVQFEEFGTKKMLAGFAKLKKQ